ncbi:hypothetical protein [Hymenobacter ruricola]|uniref:Uncharacterized protein n=1 Tax=Hymenobacter ruricola TaxID=2791023 RepID=A0ABS0I9W2_9BACT|nr:hypothetical protein [Hymenobacter ruricola]MBF9223699.1 hypothetical protein [Hymenobacter ruricola]
MLPLATGTAAQAVAATAALRRFKPTAATSETMTQLEARVAARYGLTPAGAAQVGGEVARTV